MANLARILARRGNVERDSYSVPFQNWVDMFSFNGINYPLSIQQTLTGSTEAINGDYGGLIRGALKQNGIVAACLLTHVLHFSQIRFQYRNLDRSGSLYGRPSLDLLEHPWTNGATSDLLSTLIMDFGLAGNAYIARQQDRLFRLRPDWTYIVLGSRTNNSEWEAGDADTDLVGYQYHPGGLHSGKPPVTYFPNQVAHFAPFRDPEAMYRGMSWLTPVIREIQADMSMTTHKQKFFDQGSTVNLAIKLETQDLDMFNRWVEKLEESHRGLGNAYKTLYLGAGATPTQVGSDMQQNDFKMVQGATEVRIATAARIPATLLGISEGLQGSTLNAGNYASARRNFADGFLRPLWEMACHALAPIIDVPAGAELWYDERENAFLKEDFKDAAEVRQMDAVALRQLLDSGFDPNAAVNAIVNDDFNVLLNQHSGLFSVQLQPPGSGGTVTAGTV